MLLLLLLLPPPPATTSSYYFNFNLDNSSALLPPLPSPSTAIDTAPSSPPSHYTSVLTPCTTSPPAIVDKLELRPHSTAAMDRFTSTDLMHSSKRVTRSSIKKFKSMFPFLKLPSELRNMIYKYATTDPQRFEDFFDKYYERLLAARAQPLPWKYHDNASGRMLAPPTRKAPNIFLINKQIFEEASYYFFHGRNNRITFNHGLLEFTRIREVISPLILQNITSITVSDSGHNEIIQLHEAGITEALPCSWNGYMRLLTQLGNGLALGHSLKEFTIDFSRDTRLSEHLVKCAVGTHDCGFKDQFQLATNTLRGIRGVNRVTLIGLNPVHAAQLKARMESAPVGFSDLPEKVRNIIYSHALGWNDISDTIMRAVADQPEGKKKSFPYPILTTPTVLLMNKKFSAEATKVLNDDKQVLRFELPINHGIKPTDMPGLSRFIGRTALKSVRAVEIKMESRDWVESLDRHFISALASLSSKLKSFELVFLDDQIDRQWPEYPDNYLRHHLDKLRRIRGLDTAEISGLLPICYTDPLALAMTTPFRATLPKSRVLRRGAVADLVDDSHYVAQ